MKKSLYLCMLIGFITVATIFYGGCAHKERAGESTSLHRGKVYQQPYDAVWDAVHSRIFTDLGCVEKTVNKKKGYIETEWATLLTAGRTWRWRIIAQVKQKNDRTLVLLSRIKPPAPAGGVSFDRDIEQTAGGKHSSAESSAADNLYEQLKTS
jgi:hypothetical protein